MSAAQSKAPKQAGTGRARPAEQASTAPAQTSGHALWVLLGGLLLCLLTTLYMAPYVPDDSYISFRYAENLARGHGLAFNPGEAPVEAYSNLLWILLCAFVFKLGLELPSYMPFAGAVVAMFSVYLLWILMRRRRLPPLQMLFPLLLLGSSGPFTMYAISGLEMPLFATLLLLAMVWLDSVFSTGKLLYYILLALTGVLLALCRPEGLIAAPMIFGAAFYLGRGQENTPFRRTRGKHMLIGAAVFLGLIAIYNVWRINYFGEVLPTPFLSKAGGGKSLFHAWGKNLSIYFDRQGYYFPPVGQYFVALGVVALLGRMMSNAKSAFKRTETIALLVGLAYYGVYFNFVDWMPGMRYHAALVGLLLLPAAHVHGSFFEGARIKWNRARRLQYGLVGVALVFMSYSVLGPLRIIASRTEEANRKSLIELGKWLRDVLPSGSTLAMSDVGAVPYYSGFRTIDIHPESLTDLYIAKNGFKKEYLFGIEPDVVIIPSRSIFMAKVYPEHYAILEDEGFKSRYRLVGVSRYDWYNDRCYHVLIHNKHPKISAERMSRFPHGLGTIARKYN